MLTLSLITLEKQIRSLGKVRLASNAPLSLGSRCPQALPGLIAARNCGSATTPETALAWNSGGGGGTSYAYTQPFYQAGVVPNALALRNQALFGPIPLRVEPDISMDADAQSGMLIGLTRTFPSGVKYGSSRRAAPASPPRFWPG